MMYKGKINLKGQMFGEWTVLSYNSNKSEADIMNNNGFYKIYDSGNLRLIYDKSAIY